MRSLTNDPNNDRKVLEHWATRKDLEDLKKELLAELKTVLQELASNKPKKWLKSYEVRKILNISAGTLQTLRMNGTLPYTKMGGALYYDYKDIEMVLDKQRVFKRKLD